MVKLRLTEKNCLGVFHDSRKEAVTLPGGLEVDVEDVARTLNYSDANTTTGFQQTAYFAMVSGVFYSLFPMHNIVLDFELHLEFRCVCIT